MRRIAPFSPSDGVIDLINADYDILPVLSRFSLPLGFGSKSIGELCASSGINTDVFLLVVNFLVFGEIDRSCLGKISPIDIATFLHNSHDYYLNYKFPHIRANLIGALDPAHADVNPVIVKYFDDYIKQVETHFRYEENMLFPYVKALLDKQDPGKYKVDLFARQHDHELENKLNELKNIILRYYITKVPYRMYDVLVDIYNCEEDLQKHAQIEDHILVPLIRDMERDGQ